LFIASSIQAQELSEEQMKEMYELMLPGEEHNLLKQFEGKWITQYIYRMAMDQEPITSPGESDIEMILDGRFLRWTSTGDMMGQKVESLTIIGFDRRFKYFTIYGFDTMGTYAVSAEGEIDPETNIITFEGTNYEPAFEKETKYQMKFDTSDKDKIDFSVLFETPDGSDFFPIMRITGIRTK
jgi:hypothetical protein